MLFRQIGGLAVVLAAASLVGSAAAASSQIEDPIFLQPSVPAVDVDALQQIAGEDAPEVLERLFLSELLRTAPPAPMPRSEPRFGEGTTAPGHSSVVAYDPVEGKERISVKAMPSYSDGRPGSAEGFSPGLPTALGDFTFSLEGDELDESSLTPPNAITPTPPSPITNTTSFPWRTVVKMLMRFNVSGTNYYYVCSGATVGDFMVWSAGHCVYNHDPNDDGSTADARWASEVWVWPGQTERVYITGLGVNNAEDWPYGVAKMVYMRAYTGWTSSQDITWDFSWITLDRRIGTRVGWMGWEWGTTASSLNFDGYPAETPYVPSGEMRQYPGYDTGNVNTYYTRRITMYAYTYGGHSGGPVWRFASPNRYIQGVNSTSNRTGAATAQRVTSDINSITSTAKAEDEAARPPVARPELIEYVISTTAKELLTSSVVRGGTIQVEYNMYNAGYATTTATVDFYLSTNNFISTGDRYIGSRVWSMPANSVANSTATLTVGTSVPAGSYYVGWIMKSSVAEYNSGDWAVIGPDKLTVNNPPPDLHVPTVTISESLLCTNQPYTINATVHNQGGSTSSSTTLNYCQSVNSTISTADPVIGVDAVGSLGPGSSSPESTVVNAPASTGTWWIGACVDPVSGETVTNNQCYSPGRMITVIPDGLTISNRTYAPGVWAERAAYLIDTGPNVVVTSGAIVTFTAEMLAIDNGFTVDNSGTFTGASVPPPAACP